VAKTLKVVDMLDIANQHIANEHWTTEQRIALQFLTEDLLFKADAYKGFTYLDGWPCEDETRVCYFK